MDAHEEAKELHADGTHKANTGRDKQSQTCGSIRKHKDFPRLVALLAAFVFVCTTFFQYRTIFTAEKRNMGAVEATQNARLRAHQSVISEAQAMIRAAGVTETKKGIQTAAPLDTSQLEDEEQAEAQAEKVVIRHTASPGVQAWGIGETGSLVAMTRIATTIGFW